MDDECGGISSKGFGKEEEVMEVEKGNELDLDKDDEKDDEKDEDMDIVGDMMGADGPKSQEENRQAKGWEREEGKSGRSEGDNLLSTASPNSISR